MQDLKTGAMHLMDDLTQESMNRTLPIERQGSTFYVGEEVRCKDGKFRVTSIGKKMIVLEGLPGTDIRHSTGAKF